MTIDRETVIRLARETGLPIAWISETGVLQWSDLERFAALVLEHGRKPLTDEQIGKAWACVRDELVSSASTKRRLVRAIEAAHGITNKESSDAE